MKIRALTLFPGMFDCLNHSMLGRAFAAGIIDFKAVNIRDYSLDRHFKCDDVPYGGGAGMVMTPQPIVSTIRALDPERKARRIYLSPKGRVLDVSAAQQLASYNDIIFLCGHYEGVDQRVIDLEIDDEISVGDYVLTGGELAAMVVIDCVSRFVPGVLGSCDSAKDESFSYGEGLLEYPHYTRPQEFEGLTVPEVLISGHHANIEKWRRQKAEEITAKNRPDIINK